MTAAVLSLCQARARRAGSGPAAPPPPPAAPPSTPRQLAFWVPLGNGWSARPGPSRHKVWLRWGLRERLYEACRLGRLERPLHCPACQRQLRRGEVAYREVGASAEDARWRETRICARCVSAGRGEEASDG